MWWRIKKDQEIENIGKPNLTEKDRFFWENKFIVHQKIRDQKIESIQPKEEKDLSC